MSVVTEGLMDRWGLTLEPDLGLSCIRYFDVVQREYTL